MTSDILFPPFLLNTTRAWELGDGNPCGNHESEQSRPKEGSGKRQNKQNHNPKTKRSVRALST
eukprot:scaffold2995_cov140-Skeletonema_marinoi.AAC.6